MKFSEIRNKIFLAITFLFCSVCSFASFNFTQGCESAYQKMLLLRFNKAGDILNAEIKTNPDNFIPHYIGSYIDFLKAFITEEEIYFEKLIKGKAERLDRMEHEDKNSPYYLLIKAELHLQTAVVRIKFKEYLSAAYEFRKAYKLLESNHSKFPDFVPNKKCLGILHALIGYVPSNYKWLTRLLGFRGTIPQGLGELRSLLEETSVSQEYNYLRDETLIILMFLEFHLMKNNESAMKLAARIEENQPGPLHLFSILSIYLYSAQNQKANELLAQRKSSADEFPFYYLEFMNGMALLNRLDTHALHFLKNYTDRFKGNSFVKSSYQKMAWIALLKGDTAAYFRNLNLLKTKGNDFTDEDKQAQKEAESKIIPNILLLRSRLLFDGGYYDRSLEVLAGKEISLFPKFSDQLEFTYRIARIYDKLKFKEDAVKYYEQTIKNGSGYPYYFAANSALYLGLMNENEGKKEKAAYYYKLCLSMRNHEYQNSIDQRAEAGLNRLGMQ